MSKIAVLGAGRVGGNLAGGLAKAGHTVTVATRDGAQPQTWQGPELTFATLAGAIADADLVINALPGAAAVDALTPHADVLAGKVLVDVANATTRGGDGRPGGLTYPGSSLGEELQSALPATKVVKSLNTMLFVVMTNPGLVANAKAFLSGNDQAAKDGVRALLSSLGWDDSAIEDLGGIETARALEAFILLVPVMLQKYGMKPFAMAIAQ